MDGWMERRRVGRKNGGRQKGRKEDRRETLIMNVILIYKIDPPRANMN